FEQALAAQGVEVSFATNAEIRDSLQAIIAENVSLIKSIPQQYLNDVQGVVMRSYSMGRDLGTMTKELQALYPPILNRAKLISRDQSNKANGSVNRTRQLELGIKKAKWMHSSGGKKPRPDHVAADGREYDIADGCLISGEYILPGQKINCRCVSRAILPF
ncbi:MAG: Aeromonas phage 4, partial [Pseudomonadota bacterium]